MMNELERKEISGLDLKVELGLQRTFLTTTCSLLNLLLLSKRMETKGRFTDVEGDLVITWNRQMNHFSNSSMYQQKSSLFADNF